jgi:hypothetical protein
MRVTLDRDGPLSHAISNQRTSTERINSQSKELGIKRAIRAQSRLSAEPEYADLLGDQCACPPTR